MLYALVSNVGYGALVPPNDPPAKLPMGPGSWENYAVTNSEFITNGSIGFQLAFTNRSGVWDPDWRMENLPRHFTNYQDFVAVMASNANWYASHIVRTNPTYTGNPVWYSLDLYQNAAKGLLGLSIYEKIGPLSQVDSNRFASCTPYYLQPYIPLGFTSLEVKVRNSNPPYTFGITNGVMTVSSDKFPAERYVPGYFVPQQWYCTALKDVRITLVVTATKWARYAPFGGQITPPVMKIYMNESGSPTPFVTAAEGAHVWVQRSKTPHFGSEPWVLLPPAKGGIFPIDPPKDGAGFFRAQIE